MTTILRTCIAIVAMTVPPPAPTGLDRTVDPPAILGGWHLNRELSDDPREKLRELRARERRGPGMGGGMGGPGDMSPGGMGGRPGRGVREARREMMGSLLEARESMVISLQGGAVVFDYGAGRTARVTPDGKKVKDHLDDVEIKAQWKGDRLVVERRFDLGMVLVEEYRVAPDTGQLLVLVEFELERLGKFKFRRVYDSAAAGVPGADSSAAP